MTTCSSPRRSRQSADALDQTILTAREECEDTPLPSALSLLTLLEPKPMPRVESTVELPLMDLTLSIAEDLQTPRSPDLRHSRLAQRWFKSIAKRQGSLLGEGSLHVLGEGSLMGETPSMIDLTQLCCGVDDEVLSSPTSIEVSFDVLLGHGLSPTP